MTINAEATRQLRLGNAARAQAATPTVFLELLIANM
jgi:hypothetical protein